MQKSKFNISNIKSVTHVSLLKRHDIYIRSNSQGLVWTKNLIYESCISSNIISNQSPNVKDYEVNKLGRCIQNVNWGLIMKEFMWKLKKPLKVHLQLVFQKFIFWSMGMICKWKEKNQVNHKNVRIKKKKKFHKKKVEKIHG